MASNTGSGLRSRSAPRSQTMVRRGQGTGALAVRQVRGFENCDHKTTTMVRTSKEPRARRNASTGDSGVPECSRQADPVGLRPNRCSRAMARLHNSGIQSATETRGRFACDDQGPAGTLRTTCALPRAIGDGQP